MSQTLLIRYLELENEQGDLLICSVDVFAGINI